MKPGAASGPRARRFGLRAAGTLLLLAAFALLLPHLTSGTEMVRLRNALLLGPDLAVGQDWAPPALPADFRAETTPPSPYFVSVATSLALDGLPDDWARAVAISRHLLGSAARLNGGAVQHDLRHTYEAIVRRGDGYCGDFVRVFTAIANAAGLTVRPWAFSFDGFGGHGHIWVEVWNRQARQWQLVDVFQNYYYTDGGEAPLSALALRRALTERSPTLRLHALHEGVPPGWAEEPKAWDYLRRGVPQWYAPWGNSVFAADAAWPTRLFAGRARALEQLGTTAAGTQPRIRVLADEANRVERAALQGIRQRVLAAAALGAAGLLLWLWWLVLRLRLRRPAAIAAADQGRGWPHIGLVGPLPPPSGGMANQCEQLLRLLREDGAPVAFVRTNAPLWPAWLERVPLLRAGWRLPPYLWRLWRACGHVQVMHVFANSGWAWHLLALPALRIAGWRGVPAIVNYRGGLAGEFLQRAPAHVHRDLAAATLVTPSAFLLRVFRQQGLAAQVVPNVIDLARFAPRPWQPPGAAPQIVVARNLEKIYDIPTALRAFAELRRRWPQARLTVAGSGPERDALQALAAELGLADGVAFVGRVENADMPRLYANADLMLNPTTADNMPISILEALASGVPVVSTDAGGIPDLVRHGETAMLVAVGDAAAMAAAAQAVLDDPVLAQRLRGQGLAEVAQYAWPQVRERWRRIYWAALSGPPALAATDTGMVR
ncbi:MAG: glycosyltransferase [Rubrivivax sp.]|nr:glycosyltransferase [Rubrivivax sp.]